jgi:hypothetical protein
MMCANDCIDRAGSAAVRTAYAAFFVNDCNAARRSALLGQGQNIFAEQVRQSTHRFVAAWRAEIDRCIIVDDRGGVRAATWVTALVTDR